MSLNDVAQAAAEFAAQHEQDHVMQDAFHYVQNARDEFALALRVLPDNLDDRMNDIVAKSFAYTDGSTDTEPELIRTFFRMNRNQTSSVDELLDVLPHKMTALAEDTMLVFARLAVLTAAEPTVPSRVFVAQMVFAGALLRLDTAVRYHQHALVTGTATYNALFPLHAAIDAALAACDHVRDALSDDAPAIGGDGNVKSRQFETVNLLAAAAPALGGLVVGLMANMVAAFIRDIWYTTAHRPFMFVVTRGLALRGVRWLAVVMSTVYIMQLASYFVELPYHGTLFGREVRRLTSWGEYLSGFRVLPDRERRLIMDIFSETTREHGLLAPFVDPNAVLPRFMAGVFKWAGTRALDVLRNEYLMGLFFMFNFNAYLVQRVEQRLAIAGAAGGGGGAARAIAPPAPAPALEDVARDNTPLLPAPPPVTPALVAEEQRQETRGRRVLERFRELAAAAAAASTALFGSTTLNVAPEPTTAAPRRVRGASPSRRAS